VDYDEKYVPLDAASHRRWDLLLPAATNTFSAMTQLVDFLLHLILIVGVSKIVISLFLLIIKHYQL
jgi:hypothetical protein